MRERDEANTTTNEKHRQLVELRREVNNVIDKKKRLEQELDRLKHHLVSVEEGYTKEAIEAEERERELRKKLQVSILA
jgi:phage shock protein A